MVRISFFSPVTFSGFLDEVCTQFGKVPGEVDHNTFSLRLTPQEYADDAVDLVELVRDYGGRISHSSV